MTDPAQGTLLSGRYRLDRLLGRGGMGAVYVALDTQLGREVAVKLFPGGEASTRFVMEARAMARVEHPNVVGIFDVAVHEGAPFLVMERLLGESLEERWERAPMGAMELLSVFIAVCDGVAAAHQAGIVHRDLKPANVFLCQGKDGSPRPPKVLDFGVAKVNDAHLTSPSVAGALVGSPRFMAPEQLRGAAPGPALDVYALGVMLYRGVTGRLPFDHPELMPLIAQIETAAATPVRSLAPGVSTALARWIEGAMARDPAARPTLASLREGLDSERRQWSDDPPTMALSAAAMHATGPLALAGTMPAVPMTTPAPPAAHSGRAAAWAPPASTQSNATQSNATSSHVRTLIGIALAGVVGVGILSVAFVGAALYFSGVGNGGADASGGNLVRPSPEEDAACQGRSYSGPVDGAVGGGQGLCWLEDPAPAGRASIRAEGCVVPEGDYIVYYEGSAARITLSHAATHTTFSIGLNANLGGRVDLRELQGHESPFVVMLVEDGSVIWDNGISAPSRASGHVTIERYDPSGGSLHLLFDDAELTRSGGRACVLNGELRARGYTAAFLGERGAFRRTFEP